MLPDQALSKMIKFNKCIQFGYFVNRGKCEFVNFYFSAFHLL